jgi:hypothetical protein
VKKPETQVTDQEIIAKARDLAPKLQSFFADGKPDYVVEKANMLLPLLADIAEKRGAMAVEGRAKVLLYTTYCHDEYFVSWEQCCVQDEMREKAAKELDIESSQWRNIGPREEAAICWTINLMGDCDASKVLRRLIGSEE